MLHTYIYIYTYTYVYVYICTYTYTYVYVYVHIHIYKYTYVHTYICICIHMYLYIYICICIHIHMYIYAYVHIHVYICVYKYICTYNDRARRISGNLTVGMKMRVFGLCAQICPLGWKPSFSDPSRATVTGKRKSSEAERPENVRAHTYTSCNGNPLVDVRAGARHADVRLGGLWNRHCLERE